MKCSKLQGLVSGIRELQLQQEEEVMRLEVGLGWEQDEEVVARRLVEEEEGKADHEKDAKEGCVGPFGTPGCALAEGASTSTQEPSLRTAEEGSRGRTMEEWERGPVCRRL